LHKSLETLIFKSFVSIFNSELLDENEDLFDTVKLESEFLFLISFDLSYSSDLQISCLTIGRLFTLLEFFFLTFEFGVNSNLRFLLFKLSNLIGI